MHILLNGQVLHLPEFSEKEFETGFSIYEVIRIFKGKPLFLKDNIVRLHHSIKKSNIHIDLSKLQVEDKVNKLIHLENMEEGNIKYVLHIRDNHTNEYLYRIPSTYPTGVDYMQGVNTASLEAVRENPEIKYMNPSLRLQTDLLIQEKKVYEIILIDHQGYITEGSRSNIFFIKNNTLHTAPLHSVLAGTSRKRVIDICKQHHFQLIEKEVAYTSLSEFESAFLTGTSPLILPIRKLDAISFDVNNPLLRELMRIYFSMLEQ